jgi:hypothetical protein
VGPESSFEMEMVERTNCSVYAYDYTVEGMNLKELPAELQDKIKFQKLGLGGRSKSGDKRFRTLAEMMGENGHTWIDFLKVINKSYLIIFFIYFSLVFLDGH